MEKFDTTDTKYDGVVNEYLDANKDNQFNLETSAIAASRVFSIPQKEESLSLAKNNPAIVKMWNIFQKNNELQKATIDQIIEVQKASHSFIQLINKREMLQAAAIITVKNQLNTLNIENQQIYETIKKLAGNVLQRFTQLERKIEHVEAVASLTQWIQNLKWRKYNEDPYTKRFFRILEDFYFNSGKNFTMQNLESLKTAFDKSDIDPFKTISIEEFTTTLVDELIEHDFNESIKHSPYNEKYSFKEINSKITLPFLSSLYLITEEYNHHLERRYSVDKIRDDIKQAALCYMRKDCGIDVGAKLEYYHLGIELLNGRRLIEFLDSPVAAATKSSQSISPSSSPIEIDTSQERYKKYKDLVVTFLNDLDSPGVIDDEEREMLKMKQDILQLSDEEARKIEESVMSTQQNKDEAEKKYKAEVQKTLGDNSEITAKNRMRFDMLAESFGLSQEIAKKCEAEIIKEINLRLADKIKNYRKIVHEKIKSECEISPKTRIFLDIKLEELGLNKELADKCEKQELEDIEQNQDEEQLYKKAWKYYLGDGVSQDVEMSFNLCEKAVNKGNALAAAFLEEFYRYGVLVERNYQKADSLWGICAGQNKESLLIIYAQFHLKKRFQNAAEAISHLKEEADASNTHNVGAAFTLGWIYYEGVTVPVDHKESVKWLRKAAEQGLPYAQAWLGLCYTNGTEVSQDQAEALKWYLKAAEQGEPNAQYMLGNFYYIGTEVSQDQAEAVKWYLKAAEQGEPSAQNMLGLCYTNGTGVSENDNEAVKWYLKAAEQGETDAQNNLGDYYMGKMSEDDENASTWNNKAIQYYLKAAKGGHVLAKFNLGEAYVLGDDPDDDEAQKWYKKFINDLEPADSDFCWGIKWGFINDDIWVQNTSDNDWDANELFLEVTLKDKESGDIEFYKVFDLPPLASGEEWVYVDIMSITNGSDENIKSKAILYRLK